MNKEKYESENKLDKIQMEMNKNKIKNELEILKMNNNLTVGLDQMNKDLDLNKQIVDNNKNEEIYRLDLYKNTELRKQDIQNQFMLNMLRMMSNDMGNNNNSKIN